VYVYLLLFTRAHFVIGPWAVELAHNYIRIELNLIICGCCLHVVFVLNVITSIYTVLCLIGLVAVDSAHK
jgi:hypothetical protein